MNAHKLQAVPLDTMAQEWLDIIFARYSKAHRYVPREKFAWSQGHVKNCVLLVLRFISLLNTNARHQRNSRRSPEIDTSSPPKKVRWGMWVLGSLPHSPTPSARAARDHYQPSAEACHCTTVMWFGTGWALSRRPPRVSAQDGSSCTNGFE